jgi:hypothetical protein
MFGKFHRCHFTDHSAIWQNCIVMHCHCAIASTTNIKFHRICAHYGGTTKSRKGVLPFCP